MPSRRGSPLHIESVEFHLTVVPSIPSAHPLDQGKDLLRVPKVKAQAAGKSLRGTALAPEDVVIDCECGPIEGFKRDDVEAKLGDAIFDHTMLELEELAGAVGGLAH